MNKPTPTSSATPKQEKPVKKQPKPRRRLGPVLTVFLIFLALLAVAATVLVVNAWRELSHVTEEPSQASDTAAVEVWTPAGANNPVQAMIPPPVPDSTQASAPPATGSGNTSVQTAGSAAPAAAVTPMQPVTPQPQAAPPQERKPAAAGNKNTLDNLF